ncbi:SAV_2336 N-terminal domain-related protein [Streptomyces sp. AC550_RSS872]|uniref:SAV_2336 N-terminal domain-related protein n=1 Tax=Streptomyces sp. AC550_RSS872 TaxID=2823689 RepID=UPI001C25231B|nr:SAV_2336 N-terminal domain-related protein [Streptomyces sp. AC550_RSS872]
MSGARLVEALRVLAASGEELDADQVLDVLWLARRLPSGDGMPLDRPARAAQPAQQPPATAEPDETTPSRHTEKPDPDDPELPDLTAPSLFAAARQAPPVIPGIRLRQDPEPGKALPVRVPEDKALTGELELGRALRPLRRRQPSPHRLEIDEEGTAAELAETLLPDVVLRPVQERWLHLALLVDDGLSMLLWHRLGAELRTLLERLGAFATTRVLGLDARSVSEPRLHARPFQPDSTPVPLSAVGDPSGRTLVLVVSDGMGGSWRSGALHDLLSFWASRGPAALLHTLPHGLWEGSGVHAERWQATTRRIGGANTSWEITDPVLPPDLARFDGVPVPVLEPTAASLRDWAHLLASPGATVELPLLARPLRSHAVTAPPAAGNLQHFRDAATPEAYRLAAHLAAVSPLTVPVMRLVQAAVPWQARTSHLAEVFLGGLMQPHPAPVPGPLPAKHQVFDFSDTSRATLLDAVPQSELLRTSRSIGRRLERLAGSSPDFPAWLAHPDGSAQLPGSHRPFTSVERRLLTRFGVSFDPGVHGLEREPGQSTTTADGWQPLTDDDPRELGPYRLHARRRLRRTVEYDGTNKKRRPAMVRIARPDLDFDTSELIALELQALRRLDGQYAPAVRGNGFDARTGQAWLATDPIRYEPGPSSPPRLSEIFNEAHTTGTAPFDKLTALLIGWHLASALALCHLHEIVPVDFSAENIFVQRRTVLLGDLSDCAVAGRYVGTGPVPTPKDNVRALGDLLQLISSKAGRELHRQVPGGAEGMHMWQGDTWAPLRQVVLRCFDADPAERPTAGEVADVLANYIARSRAERAPAQQPDAGVRPVVRVPLTLPRPLDAHPADPPIRPPRLPAARRERAARLARLRRPLDHARRITLLGTYHYSGRATTTITLGSLLAAVRGEPVLALDGAAGEGALGAFLTRRNPATVRDLADLPADASYDEVRARTTRLSSGLEVAAHPPGHVPPNLAHTQAYAQALARTAPYYSFVLTDWAPLRLDRSADTVLDLTDRLILCCGSAGWFLDATWRVLDRLRGSGRRRLADEAIVVVTQVEGLSGRPVPDGLPARFGIGADQVVAVPFDKSLHSPGFRELDQLRTPTLNAFLDLAELVVRQ